MLNLCEIILLPLVMVFAGFVRGYHEGMALTLDSDPVSVDKRYHGLRSHYLFGQYHAVSVIRSLAMIGLGVALWNWWSWLSFTGGMFLLWEATEIGYSLARQKRAVCEIVDRPREHVNFADIMSIDVTNSMVWLLHAGRLVVGVTLIIMGGIR